MRAISIGCCLCWSGFCIVLLDALHVWGLQQSTAGSHLLLLLCSMHRLLLKVQVVQQVGGAGPQIYVHRLLQQSLQVVFFSFHSEASGACEVQAAALYCVYAVVSAW